MKKSKKSIFSATNSIDFLNENWDDNTIYRFDNGDRDNSVLYVLSNAPSEIAEKVESAKAVCGISV